MTVDGPSTMVKGVANPQLSLSTPRLEIAAAKSVTAAPMSVVAAAAVRAAKSLDPPFAHSTT